MGGYGLAAAEDSTESESLLPRSDLLEGEPLYGESSQLNDDGDVVTSAWQQGEVTEVADTQVTVRSADGTEWTWTLTEETGVTSDGDAASTSDIAVGDTIRVSGRRSGDERTALQVQDPPMRLGARLEGRLENLPDDIRERREERLSAWTQSL
ncbi:hypothetical protein [Jiangella asiatica]|uniref:Uncharacterized protein n=1 Tax=Jiangella asiatica TaxID=2530372 RepID=A0A4R5D9Q4_9ACTN|nr:hypothetical protein [Jiangella asiatica]TDE08481.1 hypothetical protein E1269_17400 [Jiangella asiatica]